MGESALKNVVRLRVRYAETDQMGVVYHANYLVWCEIGRTELMRALGSSYSEIERNGVLLAVSDASLRFHASARYDDEILVETTLVEVRSRSITFSYRILRAGAGEPERLVSARTTLVALGREGRPRSMPAELLQLFRPASSPTHA